MKSKFKVGYKVRILEAELGARGANGKVGVIIKKPKMDIKHSGLLWNRNGIWVKLNDCRYFGEIWNIGIDVTLELIPSPTIIIYPNKTNRNETIAILKENGKTVKTTKVTCSPTDTYDFNIGAELAVKRLLNIEETAPLPYKEVKRLAKPGEYVKIVNACNVPTTNGKPDYKNGDILKLMDNYRYAVGKGDDNGERVLYFDEYVVLEGYQPEVSINSETIKSGTINLSAVGKADLLTELSRRIGE